jgi:hypothetical protein
MRRHRVLNWLFAAGVAVAALLVYVFVEFAFHINDTGPEYYPWSPLVRYHESSGLAVAGLLFGYAAIPAVLAIASSRARGVARGLLAAAAVATVFLPALVPSLLDRDIRGDDPALLSDRYGSERTAAGVRACMKYAVEGDERKDAPTLCVIVAGPRADELLHDGRGVEPEDIASDLNFQGIEPRKLPASIRIDGLSLVSARWT